MTNTVSNRRTFSLVASDQRPRAREAACAAAIGLVLACGKDSPAPVPAPLEAALVDDASDAGPARAESKGRPIEREMRPVSAARACSFRRPICVHSANNDHVAEALRLAERAWDLVTGPLALQAPLVASDTGKLDVYLEEGVLGLSQTALLERDPIARFDRAAAFVRVDSRLSGCALEAAVTRGVLRAALLRMAPATDEATAEGTVGVLLGLATPCALAADTEAIAAVQAHPESSVADASTISFARGAGLFFGWIDDAFARTPGAAVTALWALSPTRTPGDATHFWGSPDAFDVLRASFKGALFERSTLDDLLVDYGVARAFVGSAADVTHYAASSAFGDAGVVTKAWDIDWPVKPRRLASPAPVSPTGSTFVAIRTAGRPPSARLRIESDWEELMKLRWVAVKLDPTGAEIARVPVTTPEKATHAALTLTELDATSTVLLVGTSVGAWDEHGAVTFDPDDGTPEPHGWLLTVASEP